MSKESDALIDLPSFAGPDLNTRKPKLTLPSGATDCHVHVLGPRAKYRYSPERLYSPPDVFLQDYLNMLAALGCERAVLVQSGIHGVYNEVIVDAIAQFPDLHHKIGVQYAAAGKLAARVKGLGWQVQFLLDIEDFPDLDRALADYPVEVVIDHMGRPNPRLGVNAAGFQALLRLLRNGRAWAKLSGPYRTSTQAFPYADIVPFAHALVVAVPDRLLWGTDWPHVMLESPMPNDGDLCELF